MMHLNAYFGEQANIVGAPPVDLAGASGAATPWVSLKNYQRASVVFMRNAGAAGEAPIITLQQATAVAGTGAKNLVAITRVFVKEDATVSGIGTWTVTTQSAAHTFAATAAVQGIYVIDIDPIELDQVGGFDCIRATVADVGTTANQGVLFLVLWGSRYAPPLTAVAN